MHVIMCRVAPQAHSVYQTQNVPDEAIAMPSSRIDASHLVHLFSRAIFALMGPITHMRKAKSEPKMPIIELNSGMAIETATAIKVMRVR
jgi:hypothetical protein